MTEQQPASMMKPPIEELLATVDSKFTLVTLTSRRAREIITYFSQLGQGLGSIVPPQVATASQKPVSIALEEIVQGRIIAVRRPPVIDLDGTGEDAPGAPTAPQAAEG